MVDLIELANAQVDTFRSIPELVEVLTDADPARIYAYIDTNPDQNKIRDEIYQKLGGGEIMIAWVQTVLNETRGMSPWIHRFQYYFRADRDRSPFEIVDLLINGVPQPGNGLRWRFCGVMAGVDPVRILEVNRQVDAEHVDYFEVTAEFRETGDPLS
jgi:hypothetical protein